MFFILFMIMSMLIAWAAGKELAIGSKIMGIFLFFSALTISVTGVYIQFECVTHHLGG